MPRKGMEMNPLTDETLTITPDPAARIPGMTAWIVRSGPIRFVSSVSWASATGWSSTAAKGEMPALFTKTSRAPT